MEVCLHIGRLFVRSLDSCGSDACGSRGIFRAQKGGRDRRKKQAVVSQLVCVSRASVGSAQCHPNTAPLSGWGDLAFVFSGPCETTLRTTGLRFQRHSLLVEYLLDSTAGQQTVHLGVVPGPLLRPLQRESQLSCQSGIAEIIGQSAEADLHAVCVLPQHHPLARLARAAFRHGRASEKLLEIAACRGKELLEIASRWPDSAEEARSTLRQLARPTRPAFWQVYQDGQARATSPRNVLHGSRNRVIGNTPRELGGPHESERHSTVHVAICQAVVELKRLVREVFDQDNDFSHGARLWDTSGHC